MKLIDADALLKQIAEDSRRNEGWYGDTWGFINTIKDAPTIDAVPVVRCKDCRHWRDDNPRVNGYHCCYRMHNIFPMKESDFCSRGERRTDETD